MSSHSHKDAPVKEPLPGEGVSSHTHKEETVMEPLPGEDMSSHTHKEEPVAEIPPVMKLILKNNHSVSPQVNKHACSV